VATLCVVDSRAVATVYRYAPLLSAAAGSSPWQPSAPVTCTALPAESHVALASISAAWGGCLQVIVGIPDFAAHASEGPRRSSSDAGQRPAREALSPSLADSSSSKPASEVHVQCATLSGDPFSPAGHPEACAQTDVQDFRLAAATWVAALANLPAHLHRRILIVSHASSGDTAHESCEAARWVVKCPAVSQSLDDKSPYSWEQPAAIQASLRSGCESAGLTGLRPVEAAHSVTANEPLHQLVHESALSPDGGCLALLAVSPDESTLTLLDALTLATGGDPQIRQLRVRTHLWAANRRTWPW
jgi:hypothetical protein